jgi:hypothetical protein
MAMKATIRVLRLGQARRLTRAAVDGELVELNSHLKWDMPVG